ncbi:MAG: LysR substrate-binding domain-containing protein, partial [Paracoccaceae bacterium]
IDAHGMPGGVEDLRRHRFVGHDDEDNRAPFYKWLNENVPRAQATFRGTDGEVLQQAVLQGAGLGFIPVHEADKNPDLVQILPPRPEWAAPIWLVTHVDLHRTPKVQAFLTHLKAFVQD